MATELTRRHVLAAGAAFWAHRCLGVPTAAPGDKVPWTRNGVSGRNGDTLRFAVVADRTNKAREGVFKQGLQQIESLGPDFVLSVGDFIQGYKLPGFKPLDDRAVVEERRQEVDDMLRALSIPFYLTPGNHDINSDLTCEMWTRFYGRRYCSFTQGNVLFMSLDSQGAEQYKPGLGEEQLTWATEVLAGNKDARWVFLTMHQPLWQYGKKHKKAYGQFEQLEEALGGRNYTVLAGHHHKYQCGKRKGMTYIKLATTGGQSKLRGPKFGEFDHIMLVDMTPDGPRISNRLLDGTILGENGRKAQQPEPKPYPQS